MHGLLLLLQLTTAKPPERPSPQEAINVLLADRKLLMADVANHLFPLSEQKEPLFVILPGDPKDGPYGPFPLITPTYPIGGLPLYPTIYSPLSGHGGRHRGR